MAKRPQALRARAARRPAKSAVARKQANAALKRELAQALERQAATADVLKVISRSTFDLRTVFETLAESAVRLCAAERGLVFRVDGEILRFVVGHNVSPEFRDFLERNPIVPGRNTNAGRAAIERRTVHNLDVQNDPEYSYGGSSVDPYRTVLAVPMLRGDELFGVFVIYRHEVRPFSDSQIALMETFADQAVIAIENTRLISETRQALERQTATAEVLQVINSSPGDLAPVFDAMLERATRLCEARFGVLWLYEGERFRAGAVHAVPALFAEFCRHPVAVDAGASLVGIARGDSFVHVADLAATELYKTGNPLRCAVVDLGGARTLLSVPLRKDDALLGAFTIYRQEVKSFSNKQIALLENFAAQAVIAME
ncbi:MAG TPA: GAF domain-containing protein, partial [Stellaceae bacterium]|nr:GAF domain-containing protein [Stellaceae bacterium]